MTLRCIIIDDEPLALNLLEKYVTQTPFLDFKGKFSNAAQALEFISSTNVDLVFVDIQMPELNGIDFSKMVKGKTKIIFTTAFSQYAVESYRVDAIDYLLKPFSYSDFLQAANKALNWYELSSQPNITSEEVSDNTKAADDSIFIKTGRKIIQLKYSSIIYIESMRDYVKIYITDSPHPIVCLARMKLIEHKLPEGYFIRVHRSYIVNKDKINFIENNCIIIGRMRIPVSDSYKNNLDLLLRKKQL
ncbi:MAG: LytTR family DNA-binding domain-containing protein [Bacteroidales bacterium]|nr:LytTR family DNA-binding domain-containing protein [Bacteroidales bacterium]